MKRIVPLILIFGFFLFVGVAKAQADWTPKKRITWNLGASIFPEIAADSSGNLHVVWQDDTPTPEKPEIFYRKSTDGGSTWLPSRRITWTSGHSITPVIAVDSSGDLHVVWVDNTDLSAEVYYTKSTNAGSTWTAPKRLTWNSGASYSPAVTVDSSGSIHVVWWDDTPTAGVPEIFYKKSTNAGSTWLGKQRLTWNSGHSEHPDITVDSSGNLHVVWCDDTPGNDEIYYKKSPDGGSTWAANRGMTWNSGESGGPDIAADSSGNLYMVWHDTTPGNHEIYYKKSTDGGSTWGANRRITWNIGWSANAAIAVDSSGNVHVVWDDETPGNHEIGYRRSTDAGSTWTWPKNLTWTSGSSADPAIAVDSFGNVHVIWDDDTPGNPEIYYRKYVK